MLDYDGTLAPLTRERAEALPDPASLSHLRAISRASGTRVAIVSGRQLVELDRLLRLRNLTLVGEHGWEERRPGGRRIRHRLPAGAKRALDRAERAGRERGWTPHLERKRAALVLHTRGLPGPQARALEVEALAAWAPLGARGALVLERTRGGIELRAAGRDKGTAARALIARSPAHTLVVFIGDDRTDEDAFAALSPDGIGVRVGGRTRQTRATARLAGIRAVSEFLARWRRATGA